jgi:PAS domain S-box-containing protein
MKTKKNTNKHKELLLQLSQSASAFLESEKDNESLLNEKKRLNDILEGTDAGTWEWNIESGLVIVNNRFGSMLGMDSEDAHSFNINRWKSLIHSDDISKFEEALDIYLSHLAARFSCEYRMKHKENRWIWVSASGSFGDWAQAGHSNKMSGTHLDITERRNLQKQIETSEWQYRTLYETTPAMLCSISADATLLSVSNLFATTLDYSKGDMVGRSLHVFMTLEFAKMSMQVGLSKFLQQGVGQELHCQFVKRNGEVIDVLITSVLEHQDASQPVRYLANINDVTEKFRIENNLRLERRRLERIVNGTHAGTWEHDFSTGQDQINDTYASMLGYEKSEMQERIRGSFLNIVHPEDAERVSTIWNGHAAGLTKDYEVEFRSQHKDGRWLWILSRGNIDEKDATGHPINIAGIHLDITARRRAIERANHAYQELQKTVDAVPSPISYWTNDLKNKFANKAYFEWFGFDYQRMPGKNVQEIMGASVFEKYLPHINKALDGQETVFESTVTEANQEQVRHVLIRLMPDTDLDTVIGFYMVAFDITDIKESQSHLEKLNEELKIRSAEDVSSNNAKGIFLANMSHELRTPMNAVLGMLLLLQKTNLAPNQLDYIIKAESAAKSLLFLLNDILDFSKIDAGKMSIEPHPFRQDWLFKDLSSLLSAYLGEKELSLLYDLDPLLPNVILGDALRIKQVLLNLGSNAIKFTSSGQVTIGNKISSSANNNFRVKFWVRDTGIGISNENQHALFHAFSQADDSTARKYGGTGLGLAISQSLVKLMGGEIQVESQLGVGSCFFFEIPLSVVHEAPSQLSEDLITSQKIDIWMMDENHQTAKTLTQGFKAQGSSFRIFSSENELLKQLDSILYNKEPSPHLVILNSDSKKHDSWIYANSIRTRYQLAQQSAPRIILLTANGDGIPDESSGRRRSLIDSVLTKPVSTQMIFEDYFKSLTGPKLLNQSTNPKNSSRLRGMNILLVEDNAMNQQVAKELLSREGATVDIAENGKIAVELVVEQSLKFDAILMDMQMPIMDGLTASKIIRKKYDRNVLPIVALTANEMPSEIRSCLDAGMNSHAGKPLNLEKLISTLLEVTQTELTVIDSDQVTVNDANPTSLKPSDISLDRQGAIDRFGGDISIYEEMVEMFEQSAVPQLDAIKTALAQDNLAQAASDAHTLKGMASMIGGNKLAALANTMEKQCSPDATERNKIVQEQCLDQLAGEMQNLLQQLKST